jgi:hypothetical protein
VIIGDVRTAIELVAIVHHDGFPFILVADEESLAGKDGMRTAKRFTSGFGPEYVEEKRDRAKIPLKINGMKPYTARKFPFSLVM